MSMMPVAWKGTPFSADVHRDIRPEGMSLLEIVRSLDVPPYFETHGVVCINAEPVPRSMWAHVRPRPSRAEVIVTLHVPLRGSNAGSVLKIIAAVAIIAIAAAISGGALGPAGFAILGSAFASGGYGAIALGAAVSIGGALAIGALSAPPTLKPLASSATTAGALTLGSAAGAQQSGVASLSGNVLSAGGPLPLVVGTHRVYPPFICEPLVEQQGINQTAEVVLVLAGPHLIADVRVGDVLADDIDEVEYEVASGLSGTPSLVARQAKTVVLNLELSQHAIIGPEDPNELEDQTTPENSIPHYHRMVTRDSPAEIWIQAVLPQGTIDQSDIGSRYNVPFRWRMREQGAGSWVDFPEVMYSSKGTEPRAIMFKIMLRAQEGAIPNPPKDSRHEGFVYAFTDVPSQNYLSAPSSTATDGAYSADSHFYAGAGNTWLDDDNYTTTGVQNIFLDNYVVTFWVGALFPNGGIFEIEIIQGILFPNIDFQESTHQHDGAGEIRDYFGYSFDSGPSEYVAPGALFDRRYKCQVSSIASVWNEHPIAVNGNAAIALRVTNRQLSQISCLASGYVDDWGGSAWDNLITTSNPAPHFRAVLAGPLVKKPLPAALIDGDDLVEWRSRCAMQGYEVNAVLEGQMAADVLRMIAGAGFARPRQSESWGVMQDRDRSDESIAQMFSFRNLRSLRWEKAFPNLPDGLRVRYDDADLDYRENELIIFDPASGTLGEALEDIRYDAHVSEDEASTRALFDMAQARARNAFYVGEADWEQIVCRRGDLVGVQHDSIDHAAGSARIKSVQRSGANVTGVTLDGSVPYDTAGFIHRTAWLTGSWLRAPKLGVAVRLDDGTTEIREATGDAAAATVLTLANTIADAASDKVVPGQLVTTGKLYSEIRRMLVLDIAPKADLEATLTFVDEASELFAYHADAVTFDGSNDWLARAAELTGNADGKAGIVSILFNVAGGAGTARWLIATESASPKFGVGLDSSNKIVVQGRNAAGTGILSMISVTAFAAAGWHHLVASWNLTTGFGQLRIDGVDDLTGGATLTNDTIDYTRGDIGIGAEDAGNNKFTGDLAQVYLNLTHSIDLSIDVNLHKFIGADLKPVFMGRFGETPTGAKPIIFLAGGVATWHANRGTGGGFTVNGALAEAATSPSDP